jgi:hypothetical protein
MDQVRPRHLSESDLPLVWHAQLSAPVIPQALAAG